MKNIWIVVVVAAIGVSVGAVRAAAQGPAGAGAQTAGTRAESSHASRSYNPLKWVKKGPKSAAEQLDANSDQDNKLTAKLQGQGLLPANTDLKDACSAFKDLGECVAALHVSHNLGLKFNCLKWDLTGAQPSTDASSCTGPAGRKAMSLGNAIHALKPDADAKAEAKYAEKQARDDLKEVKS